MVLMLLEQIVQLFLCIVLGWLLVRLHLLKPEDSRVLSKVCLYLVTPCVIIDSFQTEWEESTLRTLAVGTAASGSGPLPWGRHWHPRSVFHCHGLTAPPPASDAGGTGLPDLHQFR